MSSGGRDLKRVAKIQVRRVFLLQYRTCSNIRMFIVSIPLATQYLSVQHRHLHVGLLLTAVQIIGLRVDGNYGMVRVKSSLKPDSGAPFKPPHPTPTLRQFEHFPNPYIFIWFTQLMFNGLLYQLRGLIMPNSCVQQRHYYSACQLCHWAIDWSFLHSFFGKTERTTLKKVVVVDDA